MGFRHAVLDAHGGIEIGAALGGRLGGVLDQAVHDQRLVDLGIVGAVQAGNAGLEAGQVAFLEAGAAVGVRLGHFIGQAVQRAGRGQQAWRGRHQVPVAHGLGVALGDQLFHGIDVGRIFLLAGGIGIDPGFQLGVLLGLAGQEVAAFIAVEHALAVLVVIVDAGDLASVFQARIGIVLGLALDHGQGFARGLDESRVVLVEGVGHFRWQAVTVGAARVAGHHDEVAFLDAVLGDFQVVLRYVGNIVLGVVGGLAILAHVGAVKAVVARVAGPHPVVRVAAEFAHAGRRRMHQAHVADFQLLDQVELEAAVVAGHGAAVSGIFFALGNDAFLIFFHRIDAGLAGQLGDFGADDLAADVADVLGDEDAAAWRGRQFFSEGLGQETVGQQIVFLGRIDRHAVVDAVVVGDDQAFRRHEGRGAAAQADDGAHG